MERDTSGGSRLDLDRLLRDPTTSFALPLRARSRSPQRGERPARVASGLFDEDEKLEDFQPLTEDEELFGINPLPPAAVPFELETLNEYLRNRQPDESPQDILKRVRSDPVMQQILRFYKLTLDLNEDGTEFIVQSTGPPPPQPESIPAPAPVPVVTGVSKTTTTSSGFVFPAVDINSYQLRVATLFHKPIIRFATTLAGKLNLDSVSDILQTGLEDLSRIVEKTQMSQLQHQALSSTQQQPLKPNPVKLEDPKQYFSPEELQILRKLRVMSSELGDTTAAMNAYRYLTSRKEKLDLAYLNWLQLPLNMSQVYFKPVYQAGLDSALDEVADKVTIPRKALFYTIINSGARVAFAELVAALIKNSQVETPNSYPTGISYNHYNEAIRAAIARLSKASWELEDVAPESPSIMLTPLPIAATRVSLDTETPISMPFRMMRMHWQK